MIYNPNHIPTIHEGIIKGETVVYQNLHLRPMLRATGTFVKVKP